MFTFVLITLKKLVLIYPTSYGLNSTTAILQRWISYYMTHDLVLYNPFNCEQMNESCHEELLLNCNT